MAGSVIGGKKASITNKLRHGEDFFRVIGAKGGKASGFGGFYVNRDLAREAGRKGGKASRRGPNKVHE